MSYKSQQGGLKWEMGNRKNNILIVQATDMSIVSKVHFSLYKMVALTTSTLVSPN